jgi:hypothetical protein
MFPKPTPFSAGDRLTATKLNQGIPILNSVASILAGEGSGISVLQSEQGTTISANPAPQQNQEFLGVITSTGPSNQADYTDARYWVKPVCAAPATGGTDLMVFSVDPPAQSGGVYSTPFPYCATNICEVTNVLTGAGTHILGTNETVYVRVWATRERSTAGRVRYYFQRPVQYIVKVTGNASGGGKYTGVLMYQTATGTIPVTGNLAETEIGAVQAVPVTILNLAEQGLATHRLTTGTPQNKHYPAIRSSRRASDDTIVFLINAVDVEVCS